MKKSQLSMEYLILFGVVVIVVLAVYSFLPKAGRQIESSEIDDFGNMLASEINSMIVVGEGNAKMIQVMIPERIEEVYYDSNSENLVLILDGKEVVKRYYGVNMPLIGEVSSGSFYVEYFNNSLSDYICIYPIDKRKECCLDFMCTMDYLG